VTQDCRWSRICCGAWSWGGSLTWMGSGRARRSRRVRWRWWRPRSSRPIRRRPRSAGWRRRWRRAHGQSNEFGLKTLVARANAGDGIFFVAMVDRIAQVLALHGDTDPVEVRRSKAIGVLATPARAVRLLASVTSLDDPPDDVSDGDAEEDDEHCDADEDCTTDEGHGGQDETAVAAASARAHPRRLLPQVTLYVHLVQGAVAAHLAGRGGWAGSRASGRSRRGRCASSSGMRTCGWCRCWTWPDRSRSTPTRLRRGCGRRCIYGTGMGNLGPLSRYAHRLRTHGGWRV
jgi:hypothetical protein